MPIKTCGLCTSHFYYCYLPQLVISYITQSDFRYPLENQCKHIDRFTYIFITHSYVRASLFKAKKSNLLKGQCVLWLNLTWLWLLLCGTFCNGCLRECVQYAHLSDTDRCGSDLNKGGPPPHLKLWCFVKDADLNAQASVFYICNVSGSWHWFPLFKTDINITDMIIFCFCWDSYPLTIQRFLVPMHILYVGFVRLYLPQESMKEVTVSFLFSVRIRML